MQQQDRIAHMEALLDDAARAVRRLTDALDDYRCAAAALGELEDYYAGPLWKKDFADDCAGRLPPALKRGVLSEDAVYNLLQERDDALRCMRALSAVGVPSPSERYAYWETYFSGQRGPVAEDDDGWLSRYAPLLAPGSAALDLGCGTGAGTGALLRMGLCVTASDFSPSAVKTAKARFPQISTACFDMTEPFPFADGQFAAVVADLSLHYFTWADTQRIIGEIRRVLAPGGCLLARVHAVGHVNPAGLTQIEENYYVSDGTPRRYFTREGLEALLGGWTLHTLRETKIVRFHQTKRVFEIAAIRP